MPELSSWATQNAGPTGILDVQENRVHIGGLVYPHASVVKGKSGFRPGPTDPGKVIATGTPDGFVHVQPFQLFLQGGRSGVAGIYIACLDAQKDINILATPADPTNPRDDLIVAQQSDTFYGDGNSDFLVRHVVGTPAAVPVDPNVTGSTDFVTLARVRVNANATTITTGNITDLRTSGHANSLAGGLLSVAVGGILSVVSAAERNALSGIYDGMMVWRRDIKQIEVADAGAFSSAIGGYRYLTTQYFTATGTFTKANHANLRAVRVRLVGGGGGGGGAALTAAAQCAVGAGGGGGGYAEEFILAASLGTNETVTVGTGGTGGAAGANNGNTGGNTTFGAHLTGAGGTGGGGDAASGTATSVASIGGTGGGGSGGDLNISGSDANNTQRQASGVQGVLGDGGSSQLGGSQRATGTSAGAAGVAGQNFGGGGSGGHNGASQAAGVAGGNGADGICIVEVYI